MVKKKKKYHAKHSFLRQNRTGEDIDMLRESTSHTKGSDSLAYKDHIDGA